MNKKPLGAFFTFQGHLISADFLVCDVDDDDVASFVIEDLVQFVEEVEKE